jgi:valyl-tRNA synthetase
MVCVWGMLLTSPAGNDLPFDEALCEQGRNFCNKIWNALRLVKGWSVEEKEQAAAARAGIKWMHARINQTLEQIEDNYNKYRLSDALMRTYKLIWDDFCSNYLEIIKPPYGEAIDAKTYIRKHHYFREIDENSAPIYAFPHRRSLAYIKRKRRR